MSNLKGIYIEGVPVCIFKQIGSRLFDMWLYRPLCNWTHSLFFVGIVLDTVNSHQKVFSQIPLAS